MKEIVLKHEVGPTTRIFETVPELNSGGGFVEHWYSGDSGWPGIRANSEKLNYAETVCRGQGLPLGNVGFYGLAGRDRFYDETSFLVNGAILTVSRRKEFFGRAKSELPKIKVGKNMPKMMIDVLAERKDKIIETARLLQLPLEEAVAV